MSVTLVDCDCIMHQKVEIGNSRIGQYLGYMHVESNTNCNIL